MATDADVPQPSAAGADVLPWADKDRFRKIFTKQAIQSYLFLSIGMGVVALALPIVLVLIGGYREHYSISYFYHVGDVTRNVMVGSLWATGVFLILYHGLSRLENWALNIGGVAAISIAMNPMSAQQCGKGVSIHGISAGLFFLCLAVVAVGLSKARVQYIIYPPKRRWFKRAYTITGAAMLAMPALVAAIHFLGKGECASHWIFWIETLGIWAFAAYWFVKTYEYRLLLGAHRRPPRKRRKVS